MTTHSRRSGLAWLIVAVCQTVSARPTAIESDSAMASLVEAFSSSSAQTLATILSPDKKVHLALPAVHDRDCFVGADQVYYFFREFFAEHPTRSFSVSGTEQSGRHAFARAEWAYTDRAETRSQPLAFTFEEELGRWVVTEIRSEGS